MNYKESLITVKKVIEEKYLIKIEDDDESFYDTKNQVIHLNRRESPKTQYYIVLHELGHHLVRTNPNFSNLYPNSKSGICESVKTQKNRLDVVREEVSAWEHVYKIAEENSFEMDYAHYSSLMFQSLSNYFIWFKNPKKYIY
jgi:hypothetical protein